MSDAANRALEHATARAVAVRAKIRALKAEQAEVLKPLQEEFDVITGKLLAYLKHVGVQNMGMDSGTIYQRTANSVSLADRKAFKEFVIEHQAWDLIDWKANVTATASFIKTHKALPPGVNFNSEKKLGVRAPGTTEGDNDNGE